MRRGTRLALTAVELVLALGIAAGAFYVAYEAITDLMILLGMPAARARWVSPLVEAFILLGSIETILRAHETDPRARYPKALVAGACVVSVALNVADMAKHDAELLAWAAAALAPICQLCALDLALGRIRRFAPTTDAPVVDRPQTDRAERLLGTLARLAAAVRGEPAPATAGIGAPAFPTVVPMPAVPVLPRAGSRAPADPPVTSAVPTALAVPIPNTHPRARRARADQQRPARGSSVGEAWARARAYWDEQIAATGTPPSGAALARAVGKSPRWGSDARRRFLADDQQPAGTPGSPPRSDQAGPAHHTAGAATATLPAVDSTPDDAAAPVPTVPVEDLAAFPADGTPAGAEASTLPVPSGAVTSHA
jgi:hypothetical protein